MKLIMTKGLPGSGKSTWAKKQLQKGNWKRVNKDDLRSMIDNGNWSKANEKFILKVRDGLVIDALMSGYNVIIDDTNLHPKHEKHFRDLLLTVLNTLNVKIEIQDFTDVPVDTCIKRDLKRTKSVGEKVIRDMHRQFILPPPEVYTPPEGKPAAVICDIDGTLAHMNGRGPYDSSKVLTDIVDETILTVLRSLPEEYRILLVSGRKDECKADTIQWLKDNNIYYDYLWMRKSDDNRKDYVVKKELFEAHIKNDYQVRYVLDDRDQVVEMWRSLGLKCLQVAPGDF